MSPALYIAPSKPGAPSPVSVLTAIPQPMLTPYHRLLGRLILSPMLAGHALLYLSFFIQSSHPDFGSLLAKRIQDSDVQWGLGGITMAIILMVFARPVSASRGVWSWTTAPIKTKRQAFYVTHLLLVGILCFAAYFHVPQAQAFVLEALLGFGVNVACGWTVKR